MSNQAEDITKVSIIHHVAIVLVLLWILSYFGWGHPVVFFLSLLYLYKVNERYSLRLRRRLQFEERKYANQRKLLSDSETIRWLNHVVEKVWPICMEQIASQQFLLPIIPWFLDKYKPWTAKQAVVQQLYLGRNPPMFNEIRVLSESADDDHVVLELGMSFLSADDMSAILAVKLRKRLGFGMWAKMHITGMHVEGKVLVGVKFLRQWPFLGRMRVCFVEPPYFQMTVKPIFNHGVDVTELPGIAGWLDNMLAVAFEETLVEPNMLVVDVEKFASSTTESWFTVDEKAPIAYAKVEVVEAAELKPSDMNGLADPYLKGEIGPYRFRTKVQKKTLAPKWLEEFKIPITSWEAPNVLEIELRDKDHFIDDMLGVCKINISDLRGGQRLDTWFTLKNIKTGKVHLAITVLEVEDDKAKENHSVHPCSDEDDQSKVSETTTPKSGLASQNTSTEKVPPEEGQIADEYEPVDVEGQEQTGVWVHRPGSSTFQSWEPRKGRARRPETQLHCEDNESNDSPRSSVSHGSDTNGNCDDQKKVHRLKTIKRGLHKIGSIFHSSSKDEGSTQGGEEPIPTPRPNLRAVGDRGTSIRVIYVDGSTTNSGDQSPMSDEVETPQKGHLKDAAKNILKEVGKSARGLKSALKRKDSSKDKREQPQGLDSSTDASKDSSPLAGGGTPIDICSPVGKEETYFGEDKSKKQLSGELDRGGIQ